VTLSQREQNKADWKRRAVDPPARERRYAREATLSVEELQRRIYAAGAAALRLARAHGLRPAPRSDYAIPELDLPDPELDE
jgi:surfactin synthase thioesterase subunit